MTGQGADDLRAGWNLIRVISIVGRVIPVI